MDDKSGVVKSLQPFKFWWAPSIIMSGTAEAIVVKFCKQVKSKHVDPSMSNPSMVNLLVTAV